MCTKRRGKQMELKDIATCDLCSELEKREGVKAIWIDPYAPYTVKTETEEVVCDGPAWIYIVID
jgi:hypothetical protein